MFDWNWTAAERAFRRAIELKPRFASAHHGYAMLCLAHLGRLDEAIERVRLALELDPLSPFINTSAAMALYYARRFDAALEQYGKTLELEPNFHLAWWGVGRVYAMKGQLDDALTAFEKARALSGSSAISLSGLGYVHGLAGRRAEAQHLLDELAERSKRSYVSPFQPAVVCIGLREYDRAFEFLEKTLEERGAPLAWLRADPTHDPLRDDPRFTALLEKVGLAT